MSKDLHPDVQRFAEWLNRSIYNDWDTMQVLPLDNYLMRIGIEAYILEGGGVSGEEKQDCAESAVIIGKLAMRIAKDYGGLMEDKQ